MTNPTRPNSYLLWTQNNNAVRQQPTNGEQFTGFTPNFRPPSGWHNWMFGILADWISWLDFITNSISNMPASNVGHNILTDQNVQGQLDQADAFLSSLGLQRLVLTPTGNPAVFTLNSAPVNVSSLLVFLDGLDEDPSTDFTYTAPLGVPTLTFGAAPAPGQKPVVITLTANQPGPGGASQSGGYVPYGSYGAPIVVTAAGGITSTSDQRALFFVISSGGPVAVSGIPQISPGTKIGQEMRLSGTSDVDYPIFHDGDGLSLNGATALKAHIVIDLFWNGLVWQDSDRNN